VKEFHYTYVKTNIYISPVRTRNDVFKRDLISTELLNSSVLGNETRRASVIYDAT
jgi:hypothetical protein